MSKGKLAILFILIGLATINGFFALINFTSLGVPWRYDEAAPTDQQTRELISNIPGELFDRDTGWTTRGAGSGGMSEGGSNRQLHDYLGHGVFEPIDPSKVDPMKKLLEVVLALQEKALAAGFVLAHDEVGCDSFGEKGQYGPGIAWDFTSRSVDGSSRGSSSGAGFSGTQRYACVSLPFVAPRNPAVRFHWTIICDRKTKTFRLMWDYLAVSPVYVSRTTPGVGHHVQITAREDPEDATPPAPTTGFPAPTEP